MTVYAYARVSTLLQAEEGDSLEAQVRQVLAYAVIPPFCDGARSRDFKRPWPTAALV